MARRYYLRWTTLSATTHYLAFHRRVTAVQATIAATLSISYFARSTPKMRAYL